MALRRALGLVLLAAGALAAAGCGEDIQQQAARTLLEQHLDGRDGYSSRVSCTDAAQNPIARNVRTELFYCAAHRRQGGCDWWRVTLLDATHARFALYREDAGCTLPV
ncbi:MAG: hypothetical protein FJW96_04840 [Actinobacteria bacterium]|nr:hypothetical protein [Actinomycetota bacterium]